jgi:site-specific DNA recombinase
MNTEAQVRAEVQALRSLAKDQLRARWTKLFGRAPPPALTKDLIGRMIAWRIQEEFYGGHDKATLKLLDRLARGEKPTTEPRLRPGTVLMREHRGVRHTITVTSNRHLGRLYLAGQKLFQPLSRRPRHHRHLVERAPLLRATDPSQDWGELSMKPLPIKKILRCAIYTRKSTEHNLDLEFNSLDAQREACEAYIKSQAHEGWRLVGARYDDGGLSGASLDRPALQELLGDVRGGKIDVIVVYKVDRLTRSLADFAKLVEMFDQHSVSFVSITQAFNTTSSMGRLTLNVLLSFAQFEREVIGERVRDKIAASKRKGLWVGGSIPLGYATVNKKLVVVPEEAETVRTMFRLYLERGSLGAPAEELARRKIVSKVRAVANGHTEGGGPYSVGALAHFLKNRFYIGKVVYRGEIHAGEHEPIIDRSTFDVVRAKLAERVRARRVRLSNSPAILTGRIFDDRGNRMTPSHSNKDGIRYRYYVSHAVLQRRKQDAGRVARVPAAELEKIVVGAVRARCAASGQLCDNLSDRDMIDSHVERVAVHPNAIDVELRGQQQEHASLISLPWSAHAFVSVKGVLHQPDEQPTLKADARDAILLAVAKARVWIDDLASGRIRSFAEIARSEGKVERHIRLLAPLAFLPPGMLAAISDGTFGKDVTVTTLARAVPFSWAADRNRSHAMNHGAPLFEIASSGRRCASTPRTEKITGKDAVARAGVDKYAKQPRAASSADAGSHRVEKGDGEGTNFQRKGRSR